LKPRRSLLLALCIGLLLGLLVMLLAGCEQSPAEPTLVPGAATAGATVTAGPGQVEPGTEQGSGTPEPSVITLTVWTTESFSPTQAITTGQILEQQVAAFEAQRPNVRFEFVLKQPYGEAGVLDYLLTTAPVVPELLPDIAFIDVDELALAVQADVVQPLDDLIPPDLMNGLYPFARASCSFDGRLYGLQFLADLDHLVYDSGQLTIRPSSWAGVLSNPEPYLFPAGGKAGLVNDAFLSQYLAVRGAADQANTQAPFLERDPLVAVLQFYQDGVSRGIFPLQILDYHTTDDCWRDYLAGDAAMTQVSAHRYLTERGDASGSVPAPVPGIGGPAAAIGRGWAMVLVAPDPARQSLAVEFMARLMDPETNAAWNLAADYLPARQTGLAYWDAADPYVSFIQQELLRAVPRPRLSDYTQVMSKLQQAVEDVVNGVATPEEASDRVLGATR
jgi:ABC-type glycerol-3-phosphate transport system substrate-binding protein